jgi:hypothetical protein
MTWEKNPGGKRYSCTTDAGLFRLVRQNTAAGAARWRATLERGGTTRVVASVHYLRDAKAACELRLSEELEAHAELERWHATLPPSVELCTVNGTTFYGSPDCLYVGEEV